MPTVQERVTSLEATAYQHSKQFETIAGTLAELVEQGRSHAAAISALAVDHRDYRQEVTQVLQDIRAALDTLTEAQKATGAALQGIQTTLTGLAQDLRRDV